MVDETPSSARNKPARLYWVIMLTTKVAFLLLLGGLSVSSVSATPVLVSGSGFWFEGYIDAGNHLDDGGVFHFSFSGSNGTDSVSLSAGNVLHGAAFLSQPSLFNLLVDPLNPSLNGTAMINGVTSQTFTFGLGAGGGFVTFLDAAHNPTGTSVDLVSFLGVTRVTVPFEESGIITISSTPVPEPATLVLLLAGLGSILLWRRMMTRP